MAPEYALWGHLTEKANVYSFGVVALEISSGRHNANSRAKKECVCLLEVSIQSPYMKLEGKGLESHITLIDSIISPCRNMDIAILNISLD
ncbi:hypothetical protein Ddye_024363 [Dipteronia dyeriana]|uniref:Protein kinase domain-containing protein n=1 Tax=Dipteronia dyeriana TaxID=168575 RepID=A0AAD9WUD6_9ROSI|nr:hypothetical protein Ddye_024363 [Dipteronia dyeriana]